MTFLQLAYNNVIRNKRTYAAYFISSAFSVMVFFIYAMFIFHPGIDEGMTKDIAVAGMRMAEYVIFIFSFLFILYSVGTFLKSRSKQFGILVMHGMTNSQLNRLVFIENMLIGLTSILTGIVFGLVFSKLFLLIGARVLEMKDLPFYLSWKPFGLTLASFVTLFLVISFFTSFFVRGNKLIELIKGNMKPKREPKYSILLSLLSFILLIGGYFFSITSTEHNVTSRLLPVVGVVTVGTYFLFTQLSIFIVKRLKSNKKLFWKRTNLLVLSDLAYRLKDNARMFFLVCIISTVSFCAVGSLASVRTLTNEVEVDYPAAVSYTSSDGNSQQSSHHQQIIEEELKDKGLTYQKFDLTIKTQTSQESQFEVVLLKLSDYNKYAVMMGQDKQAFSDNEAMFVPMNIKEARKNRAKMDKSITFVENPVTVKAIGYVDKPFFSGSQFGGNVLIVSDIVYNSLKNPFVSKDENYKGRNGERYYGYIIENWKETKDIGSVIKEERLAEYKKAMDDNNYNSSFSFMTGGEQYYMVKQMYSVMLFIGLMIAVVFFVASGSILYFRLYSDLEQDRAKFDMISKIGLTPKELNQVVTKQLLILFFVPFVVAVIHSSFAFVALQSLFTFSILTEMIVVICSFFVFQLIYFLFIRNLYLKQLNRKIR